MEQLPPTHFLNLPRPDVFVPTFAGAPDTSTLAAHDFDVDTRTGFMPPEPPLVRLPSAWEPWEVVLEDAIQDKLEHADSPELSEEGQATSERWRNRVREVRFPGSPRRAAEPLMLRHSSRYYPQPT